MLREYWHLQRVSLKSIEWELDNLPAPLASVPVLLIAGHEVALCVPARVSWQKFVVHSDSTLVLTFEDVVAFARTPLSFDSFLGY